MHLRVPTVLRPLTGPEDSPAGGSRRLRGRGGGGEPERRPVGRLPPSGGGPARGEGLVLPVARGVSRWDPCGQDRGVRRGGSRGEDAQFTEGELSRQADGI
ncbi:unnamed protein product, partial [Darwinula stevensoni]